MKVTSRIKTMFQPELLRYIAAICDTPRISSNNQKMIMLGNLLYTYGIDFEILGGATNRIVFQIDGYAVKFAIDEQGYIDNLIEYSLSPELQPFVTKSYETNGYIQVQECVEVMSKEAFQLYRVEINKVLDTMCQDYLLGDVGYIEKNRTNWGIRGTKPVILDYAYCHRATENLFTCDVCGSALRYNSTYDILMCSDRCSCKATYSYNERKRIQGSKVDEDMIEEMKSISIKIPKGETSKDIEMFEDKLIDEKYFVVDTPGDMREYEKIKEESMMRAAFNTDYGNNRYSLDDRMDAMVRLARDPNDKEAQEIFNSPIYDDGLPEVIYTERYQENFLYNDDDGPGFPVPKHIPEYTIRGHYKDYEEFYDDEEDEGGGEYFGGADNIDDAFTNLVEVARKAKAKREAEAKAKAKESKRNDFNNYDDCMGFEGYDDVKDGFMNNNKNPKSNNKNKSKNKKNKNNSYKALQKQALREYIESKHLKGEIALNDAEEVASETGIPIEEVKSMIDETNKVFDKMVSDIKEIVVENTNNNETVNEVIKEESIEITESNTVESIEDENSEVIDNEPIVTIELTNEEVEDKNSELIDTKSSSEVESIENENSELIEEGPIVTIELTTEETIESSNSEPTEVESVEVVESIEESVEVKPRGDTGPVFDLEPLPKGDEIKESEVESIKPPEVKVESVEEPEVKEQSTQSNDSPPQQIKPPIDEAIILLNGKPISVGDEEVII